MTLAEFLTARLDEQERAVEVATKCAIETWGGSPQAAAISISDEDGSTLWSTRDLLADIAAKRRIIKRHSGYHECWPGGGSIKGAENDDCFSEDFEREPCQDMCDLASVYSDHPDYRQEWSPE